MTNTLKKQKPEGDMWLLEISYAQIADPYVGLDFTPEQRVGIAFRLYDDNDSPSSPQHAVQEPPNVDTMLRLAAPPARMRTPVVVKAHTK